MEFINSESDNKTDNYKMKKLDKNVVVAIILACKKIHDILFFQWGKVYVIDNSQGALVKRILEDKESPGNIVCHSDNKGEYPAFSMPKSDIRSLF